MNGLSLVALCQLQDCKNRPAPLPGLVAFYNICFLAGCHKKRLNQALSVLSLSLAFLSVSLVQ